MDLFDCIIQSAVDVATAPIRIPLEILDALEKPSPYEWWYHDSGVRQDDGDSSAVNDA